MKKCDRICFLIYWLVVDSAHLLVSGV